MAQLGQTFLSVCFSPKVFLLRPSKRSLFQTLFCPPAQDLGYCRGHKEKSFVSFSSDTIYACHPPFKVEPPPPSRAQVLGGRPSDLGPGYTRGQQAGDGSSGVTGWPGSLGGGGGADWPWQVSGPVCCGPLRCPFLCTGYGVMGSILSCYRGSGVQVPAQPPTHCVALSC